MTREIKFRDWDPETKEMRYFDLDGYDREVHNAYGNIMQYTGLKDKNGKEIFEGDILRRLPKDCWEKENFISFEVFYHGGNQAEDSVGFQMNRTHFHGCIVGYNMISAMTRFLPENVCKMEIIGNIYENPELVEKINKEID
jgi:uncharacterized phage protein (TIGR01671 family)